MPAPFWKPRQRPATVALVLALHLVLLAGALRLGVWPERTATSSRPPLTVQLIWQRLTSATPPAQQAKSEVQPVQPTRATRSVQEVLPTTTNAPATADPALQAITQPAAAPTEPATPAATAASAPVPLNLALPRAASAPWRQRLQALDDPRSNTPKLTLEQKLADGHGW
jgi:cytoskeletal protein RodZ